MKKLIIVSVIALSMVTGCSSQSNNLADGNVTNKEAEQMQSAWCEYNKDESFAKEQCK
ncbi:hypothetical protein [Aquibacillus saliphilus]|uniref:hypothetical protein n=1 Tax=Aquibacillus saliphilus TaxID=1909422 RepID=UPI001CF03843|nr:hypothetical protein [Aquibacillus saliphilus]